MFFRSVHIGLGEDHVPTPFPSLPLFRPSSEAPPVFLGQKCSSPRKTFRLGAYILICATTRQEVRKISKVLS